MQEVGGGEKGAQPHRGTIRTAVGDGGVGDSQREHTEGQDPQTTDLWGSTIVRCRTPWTCTVRVDGPDYGPVHTQSVTVAQIYTGSSPQESGCR
jgi:hypothetical protein